jgi:hypothetical protein
MEVNPNDPNLRSFAIENYARIPDSMYLNNLRYVESKNFTSESLLGSDDYSFIRNDVEGVNVGKTIIARLSGDRRGCYLITLLERREASNNYPKDNYITVRVAFL